MAAPEAESSWGNLLDDALLKYSYDTDDPDVVALLAGDTSKAMKSNVGMLTGHTRNAKFMYYFIPILKGYRKMQYQAKIMRQRDKKKDPVQYTKAKQAMLDEQHEKAAPMIKKLLEEMGGLYNKAAQDMVTRGMVVPPQWVEELKGCFEDMPKRSWVDMEKAISKGLAETHNFNSSHNGKGNVNYYFKHVETTPLAAASIGQVHCAETLLNERVVIKVLYPEIRQYMAADLANLKQAVLMISKLLSMAMKDAIEAVSSELCDNFPRELDFRIEQAFTERARINLAKHSPRIVIPAIYKDLSSTSILTQERIEGDTIATLCRKAREGTNVEALQHARMGFLEVLECIGKMVFVDGFFHADPHPGNIMIRHSDHRPVLIDWGQCMELSTLQRRTLCELVLMLRTRCMPLIASALTASGFGFSGNVEEGEMAALLYFFFDSAVEGPFQAEIIKLRDLIRYKPTKAGYMTKIPREVVFFGRVMTSIRRNCEDLGLEISAIDAFAPMARISLEHLLGPSPPIRSLGKSIQAQTLLDKESNGANNAVKQQEDEEKAKRLSTDGRSLSDQLRNNDDETEQLAQKDNGMWSPSRILTILPTDSEAFELIETMIHWSQSHVSACDDLLKLAIKIRAGIEPSVLLALASGVTGDGDGLVEAIKLTRGSFHEKEDLMSCYEDGTLMWELMLKFATNPKVFMQEGRSILLALSTLGFLPSYPSHADSDTQEAGSNDSNDAKSSKVLRQSSSQGSSIGSIMSAMDRSMSSDSFDKMNLSSTAATFTNKENTDNQNLTNGKKTLVDLSRGLVGFQNSLGRESNNQDGGETSSSLLISKRSYYKEFLKIVKVFPDVEKDMRKGEKTKFVQFFSLIRIGFSFLSFKSIWTWLLIGFVFIGSLFSLYGMIDVFCLFKYGMHASDVLNPHFLAVTASCWV